MKDVWEMFRVVPPGVVKEQREIDPTLAILRDRSIAEAEKDKETDEYTEQRLRDLAKRPLRDDHRLDGQICSWPTSAPTKLVKLRRQGAQTSRPGGD